MKLYIYKTGIVGALMAIFLALAACQSSEKAAHSAKIDISENPPDLITTLYINPPLQNTSASWLLQVKGSGHTFPGQRISTPEGAKIAALINPAELGGGAITLNIETAAQKTDSPFDFAVRDGKFLDLSEDGAPVLSYVYGMHLIEGVPEDRRRANYIHPIYGLDGEIVTDDFPEDHYHHRGLFFAWPTVVVDGDSLDLWHIDNIEKRFESWIVQESGPVFARFGLKNAWHTKTRRAVEETVYFTVYRKGEKGRIIDVELTLEALDSDVFIAGSSDPKGYGGCNFRPAPSQEEVITSELGEEGDSDLRRFPWADYSAVFEGAEKRSGVSIFQHTDNMNFPAGWCLRHYGFLGVAWPGNNPYLLRTGRPLTLRYRVWVHRGGADDGGSAAAYEMYVNTMNAQ